jgi:Rrf2 family protein
MSNVLKISEAASLGMHAMVYLAASPDRNVNAYEIAETLGVSEDYLQKVFQRLAHAGLVRAVRGPHGGFSLSRAGGMITLREVYEAVEGRLDDTKCLLGEPACKGDCCILGGLLESVNHEVRDYLERTVLSDLVGVYAGVRK